MIDRTQALAHAVSAVPGADGGIVAAQKIVSKADARLPNRGEFIVQRSPIEGSAQARKIELTHACGVDEGLPGLIGQLRIHITQMAKLVVRGTYKLVAETEIQRQVPGRAIVILCEPCIRGNAIVVIAHAPTGLTEVRGAGQKALPVRVESGRTGKEQQPVVRDRQVPPDGGSIPLSAEAELMGTVAPAQSVEQDEAV